MNEKEIVNSNKLIAIFMGGKPEIANSGIYYGKEVWLNIHFENPEFSVRYLKYNTSWDWLMPVYRKIRDYLASIKRPSEHHCCNGDALEVDIHCHVSCIDIEKSFLAIVEFIKWYNENENKL